MKEVLPQIYTVTHIRLPAAILCQLLLKCAECIIKENGLMVCVFLCLAYMSILIKKVQSIQIDSQNAGGLNGGGATALDVEEGGAKHGKCTDQTWAKKKRQLSLKTR